MIHLRSLRHFVFAALLSASMAVAQESVPLLPQHPTINQDKIVFVFADDLWSVPRAGGQALRLTSDIGAEMDPVFSPDGTQVARLPE